MKPFNIRKSLAYDRKRPFNSEKSAMKFLKCAKKAGIIISDNLEIYQCRYCEKWHTGHNRGGS